MLDWVGWGDSHGQDSLRRLSFQEWPRWERELAPLSVLFESPGGVLDLNSHFGVRWLETTPICSACWREHRMERQLLALLGTGALPLALVGVTRSDSDQPFSRNDAAKLEAIREPAQRALARLTHEPSPLSALMGTLAAVSLTIPEPLGLVAQSGELVWLSESATRRLQAQIWMAGLAPVFTAEGPAVERWRVAVQRLAVQPDRTPSSDGLAVQRLEGHEGQALYLVVERGPPVASGPEIGWHHLTRREREIADLMSRGHSTCGVATTLGISSGTVRNHLKRVYRKLGVNSRVELSIRCRGIT